MTLHYQAAVLHEARSPLRVERVAAAPLAPSDVLVGVRAAGLCHTDLEVIDGALRYPMPIVLGHEAAGVIEDVGSAVRRLKKGDHVILSWNPHCGHCYYCDRGLPILCEDYLAKGSQAVQFDGTCKARRATRDIPFDRASLIGCGVMTGVGAALNVAHIGRADTVMVIGCGAVGLAAVQGARLAGAAKIIAVDIDDGKLALAQRMGATQGVNANKEEVAAIARRETFGRGADVVIEAAGSAAAFRTSIEAVRPGGEVVWLGKIDVNTDVTFRWGALMQEKRIRRSSYGEARPARDFPMLAQAYLDGRLMLDELITQRIRLDAINQGFSALRDGKAIRSVITFG